MSRLVSVIGGKASLYVTKTKPSELIPFRGKFPLIENYQKEDFFNAIENTQYVEELSPEFQRIVELGYRIATFEDGFIEYLSQFNITPQKFVELSNVEKSDKLLEWLNKDCIDFSQLTIK